MSKEEWFSSAEMPTIREGQAVPVEIFKNKLDPGDIVLIYTKYVPPKEEGAVPEVLTLSFELSEYLAKIPVRAYRTDAFSVMSSDDQVQIESDSESARVAPIH